MALVPVFLLVMYEERKALYFLFPEEVGELSKCVNVLCIRQEVRSKSDISRLIKDQPLPQVPNIIMSSMNISAVSHSSIVAND